MVVRGKRPIVVDAAVKGYVEAAGKEIINKLGDQFFEVDGTPTSTVKYRDGSFKKKTLLAGWNFKLEYCYVGTRGKLIFGLSPEDAQEYEFVEMETKDLDYSFPMIGPTAAPLFQFEGEKLEGLITKVVEDAAIAEVRRMEQEKKDAEMAALGYQENEEFGAF